VRGRRLVVVVIVIIVVVVGGGRRAAVEGLDEVRGVRVAAQRLENRHLPFITIRKAKSQRKRLPSEYMRRGGSTDAPISSGYLLPDFCRRCFLPADELDRHVPACAFLNCGMDDRKAAITNPARTEPNKNELFLETAQFQKRFCWTKTSFGG
jgi:hypothetical protein